MAYPLIILGAGASFDYVNSASVGLSDYWRPPVLKDLFDTSNSERRAIIHGEKFERYLPALSASVQSNMQSKGGFEQYLDYLVDVLAPRNKDIYRELVALRFYISELFAKISAYYFDSINNYQNIIQHIKNHTYGKAIFVNFNYDLLLEKTINGLLENSINDYINGDIKVIKIHGAYNWVYIEDKATEYHADSFAYYINKAENLKNPPLYDGFIEPNTISKDKHYLPAVTLPLTKGKHFICPDRHIELLKSELVKVDRILIIGWSAADDYFTNDILKPHLNDSVASYNKEIWVISASGSEANAIANKVRNCFPQGRLIFKTADNNGFTEAKDFIREFFEHT